MFISSEEAFSGLICFPAVLLQQADGKIKPKEGSGFLIVVMKTALFSGHFCMALASKRHRFSYLLNQGLRAEKEEGWHGLLFPQILLAALNDY